MNTINKWIGNLCPNGVEYKKIYDIFSNFSGMTGVSGKWKENGNCQFIDYMNAYKNLKIKTDVLAFATVGNLEQNILKRGDILLTSASETPDECALSSVIENDIQDNIFMDDHLFGIRLKNEYTSKINTTFVNYYMHTGIFRKQVNKAVRGVTRFYISINDFMKICIPVPPIEVQCEIVRILDNFNIFNMLNIKLEEELKNRRKQFEFYLNKLIKNINYPKIKLGDIGQVKMCKRILKKQTNTENGIPFYKIGTFGKRADAYISRETFLEYKLKYSYPKKGDILISCSGTIGKTITFDGNDAYFQDSNIVWIEHDNSKVLNEYLRYFYMAHPWKLSTEGTILRLYNDNILKTEIPLPTIYEQKRIIEILYKFEKKCNTLQEELSDEIEARHKQHEYYRDKLLEFKDL